MKEEKTRKLEKLELWYEICNKNGLNLYARYGSNDFLSFERYVPYNGNVEESLSQAVYNLYKWDGDDLGFDFHLSAHEMGAQRTLESHCYPADQKIEFKDGKSFSFKEKKK
ncbi:MAG: hypothetical protein M1165_00030 [Candidatus Pacearchaeota archaeon]|jgi:hypothetical protein|nr:hypothetical protein [Candidatus Pacearchaeota archaeon]